MKAIMDVWTADPDEAGLDVLAGKLGQPGPEIALAALLASQLPETTRARISDFCRTSGLAPQQPRMRALFLALTGQPHLLRALDPDGALLVAAYQGLPESVKATARRALGGLPDLDLVGVVAGGAEEDKLAAVSEQEAAYLIGRLAGQQDWDRLWRLVRSRPVPEATEAVRLFPGDWRPDSEGGRALLRALAAADAGQISAACEAARVLRITSQGVRLSDASFSPDGRRVAVAEGGGTIPRQFTEWATSVPERITTWQLPSGAPGSVFLPDDDAAVVLHLGDGRAGDKAGWSRLNREAHVIREVGPHDAVCHAAGRSRVRLALHPDGFIAVQPHWPYGAVHTTSGSQVRRLDLEAMGLGRNSDRNKLLAIDPASGRVAFWLPSQGLMIVETAGVPRVLARGEYAGDIDGPGAACFISPDRLLTADWAGEMRVLELAPGRISLLTARSLATRGGPVVIPARGEIAVLCPHDTTAEVCYLDAGSLEPVSTEREFAGRTDGLMLHSSRDGLQYALCGDNYVDVVPDAQAVVLRHLLERPVSSLTQSDLPAGMAQPELASPALRPLLRLLAAVMARTG